MGSMVRSSRFVVLGCLAMLAGSVPAAREEPVETGLVEETGRRLVQLDVTVHGPAESIVALTPEDFELTVDGRFIEGLLVDAACEQPAPSRKSKKKRKTREEDEAPVSPPAVPERQPPVSYLFYFDQHHLTPQGRQRSLDLSRQLIAELITASDLGMIVSSGQEVRTFSGWTSDPAALLAAVDQLEKDRKQWDTFAAQEDGRVEEVHRALGVGLEMDAQFKKDLGGELPDDHALPGLAKARSLAAGYYREERWHTEKALSRFSMVLGRLIDVPSPKVVLYFADTLRSKPGEHYTYLVGPTVKERIGATLKDRLAVGLAAGSGHSGSYQRVIEDAVRHGARLYTVQAEGLVARRPASRSSSLTFEFETADPMAPTRRFREAQDALVGLAAETGGQHFLNGVPASKIANRLQSDLSCVYLISFEPGDLPVDRPLSVLVTVRKPKVKTQARTQLTVSSEASRKTDRLMAAFTDPDAVRSAADVQGIVIPTGFEDGKYSALVQVTVPRSPVSGATWDVGVSMISRGSVKEDASGRVSVSGSGVPVVFEVEMTFAPGPYEFVAVAHETRTDQLAAVRLDGDWPDLDEGRASVGPIVVVQPARAAFLREGELRREGTLGRGAEELIRTDLAAALVGIVCRNPSNRAPLRVERKLVGDSEVEFPPMNLELGGDRCAVFSDVIRAGTMTSGMFEYAVRIFDDAKELASGGREFAAVCPGEVSNAVQ